nr:ABC transporter permease [Fervidobacterium sp.]
MSEGVTTTKMNTEFRRVLRKIFRNPSAILGFSLLIFFILVAIFAPVIAKPLNPMMLDEEGKPIKLDNPYIMPIITWSSEPVPPSREHPFGMIQGRDIFYGVVWGTRTAFYIGLTVTILSTIFGIIIGSIAGYYGGWIDEILMRITDTFMSIPFLLAAMVLTTILGNGLDKVMIAMTVFGWMGAARLIRANILQVKEEQFVLAAKALGVKDFFIIIRHILPNTIFPVLIQASMRMGSLVITAAGLSFLGLGAPLGYADWGSMLNFTRNWILGTSGSAFTYWYAVFYPGMAMVLFVLAWNLVGDALRDVFDPRLK